MPRHQVCLAFLKLISRKVGRGKEIHLIVDNYGDRKHSESCSGWRPWFHLHFTPTSSSWLNLVERFFQELTTKRLKRGSFASVPELVAAIEAYIAGHNEDPKPFVWTKTAAEIIDKSRARPRRPRTSDG